MAGKDYPAEYRKNIKEIFAMVYKAGSSRKSWALVRLHSPFLRTILSKVEGLARGDSFDA
jgi:hypothetical protein